MDDSQSIACNPIKWGQMYCHNYCYQTQEHETRAMKSAASWVMVPDSVYAIQGVRTSWQAGKKYRHGGFRRLSATEYDTPEKAMEACQKHKFDEMVSEIADLL